MVGGVDAPDALRLGVGRTWASTAESPVAVWTNQTPSTSDERVGARLPGEQPGVGELTERGGGIGGDHGDAGTGVEQALRAARSHRPAAHHQHGAAEEAQCRGVNVLNCHESTVGPRHIHRTTARKHQFTQGNAASHWEPAGGPVTGARTRPLLRFPVVAMPG